MDKRALKIPKSVLRVGANDKTDKVAGVKAEGERKIPSPSHGLSLAFLNSSFRPPKTPALKASVICSNLTLHLPMTEVSVKT